MIHSIAHASDCMVRLTTVAKEPFCCEINRLIML